MERAGSKVVLLLEAGAGALVGACWGTLVVAVGVECERKKLAIGSGVLTSVAPAPPPPEGVLGMDEGSRSDDVAGARETITLWKVVMM
jgi:hypothetical protein